VDFQIRITEAAPANFEEILAYPWAKFPATTERFGNAIPNHDTRAAVATRSIAALRAVRGETMPKKVYGCEVWRDPDWAGGRRQAGTDGLGALEYRGGAGGGVRLAGDRRQAVRPGDGWAAAGERDLFRAAWN
jgi:hypothetical protein